jgi:hypothetical protein
VNVKVKTAAPGRSWLVFDENTKVASVHKTDEGFIVACKGSIIPAKTVKAVRKQLGLDDWEPEEKEIESQSVNDLAGYTADCESYFDPMIEAKRRLPLFTKVPGSKCFFAAGWYRINYGTRNKIEFCPKLLTLNRNRFWGPFHTKEEAESLNN